MDRSLYPDGVEVGQADLGRTEDTRAFHILRRHIDNSSPGVVQGLVVTPNTGSQTLLDVSTGYGYCSNGELVELDTAITAIALANNASGAENIVALVYTETNESLKPHETNGDSFATAAIRSARLRVFTRAQYDALPQTSVNLNEDSLDRILIIAVVTAQGSGIGIPQSAISSPPIYGTAINVTNTTQNVTGVTIIAAESGTPNGVGALDWDFNAGTLAWTAPDDASGNPINVLDGGTFELNSFPSGKKLTVFVADTLLSGSSESDVILVGNLYYEDAPRHTSEDAHHRSLVGSGIPTPNNPHGLTLSDLGISGTPIEEHQFTFHSNGIRRDSDPTTLALNVNVSTSPDQLTITVPTSNFFVYLRGSLFTGSEDSEVLFNDVVDNTQILFDIYADVSINNNVHVEKWERVRFDGLSTFTSHVQLMDISINTGAGAGQIYFDDAADTLSYQAPGGSFGPAIAIPSTGDVAMRLWSSGGEYYIDVLVKSTLAGIGSVGATLTVSDIPAGLEYEDRLLLGTVMFSGSSSGFLGNGFNSAANAPNAMRDKRLFGTTSPFDIRDDAQPWYLGETTEAHSPAAVTKYQVGIIDPAFDYGWEVGDHPHGQHQLTILAKGKNLKRGSINQRAIFSAVQYSEALIGDGIKSSIQAYTLVDHPTGTINNVAGIGAVIIASGDVQRADAFHSQITIVSSAVVSTGAAGHRIASPTGTLTNVANLYGLYVENQSGATNNYALYTNSGIVRIGDNLLAEGAANHKFRNASGGSINIRAECETNNGYAAFRLTETPNEFLGGFIKYDSNGNKLHIGTHATNNETEGNDINAIRIDRDDGKVGILRDGVSGYELAANNIYAVNVALAGYIDWNGTSDPGESVILGPGNPEISDPNSVSSVANGVADSWRIRHYGNQTANIYGINSDALIIEKTDANSEDPDGNIVFVNTGRTSAPTYASKASLFIRGNGSIHPNWTTDDGTSGGTPNVGGGVQSLGRNEARWGDIFAAAGLFLKDFGFGGDPITDQNVLARHQRNAIVVSGSFTTGSSSPSVHSSSWNVASIARIGTTSVYDCTLFHEITLFGKGFGCTTTTGSVSGIVAVDIPSRSVVRIEVSSTVIDQINFVVIGHPRFTQ